MKDIPIIFSGPMVRALLDGRKTMTRRLLKPQPEICFVDGKQLPVGILHVEGDPRPRLTIGRVIKAQEIRFAPGDRLWVRETWQLHSRATDLSTVVYRASINQSWTEAHEMFPAALAGNLQPRPFQEGWRSPLHIPRWASRLTLVVTDVKVERLQDISEADAEAEGVSKIRDHCFAIKGFDYDLAGLCHSRPSIALAKLWMHLNGDESWEANPYVVAITFTVHKQNIDALPKADTA